MKSLKENWSRRAVVYQIYPRSFKDSNGDGVGDLNGIIEKLDYLNDGTEKSLGIGAIWLSPIYKSPMVDFGYDISDYYDIDPLFGNLKTFDKLIFEAHRRGIKVIMDFVPNHTSSQHPWFLESRSSRNNPKRDWYIWRDPKRDGLPPNNWLSVFGGSAWTLDENTQQYYLHSYLAEQPDLNWRNQEVRDEMVQVLKFWLNRRADGLRTDAIYYVIKDVEFRDDPQNPNYIPGKDDPYNALFHIYSQGRPEIFDTTNTLCEVIGKYEDKFMVSEVYLDLPDMVKMYKACANKLHAPFNFNLMNIPWDAGEYKKFIDDFEELLTPEDLPIYVLGNHDRSRLASRLGRDRARLAAMLLLTLRGMPFIYYGEELGMKDVQIPTKKVKDPWEKQTPGFRLGRDPERTPMQWNTGPYAGFSDVEPWLPVAEDYKKCSVETDSADPHSMFNLYRQLIHFRKDSPALLQGSYRSLDIENNNILGFVRESVEEKLLILLNFSGEEEGLSLTSQKAKVICNTYLDKEFREEIDLKNFSLRPYEGYVFTL
ncbi:MAG: alpha-amylase family glycosyl hydrolase [Candidatus Brocadiales bacterium]